ncbi:hypothetical protein [Arenimonas sp.]|uniref:hypothetical protein n=1 Tax=Arenimonas sp. TaxID=1872635 RepID=UPI0035AF4FFB
MFRSILLLLLAAGLLGCQGSDTPDAGAAQDAELVAERAELERLESQVVASRDAVTGFEVLHASYGHGPDPVTGQQVPAVKVALANGSPVTVARVSLLASFANEGGGDPWLDQVFDVPLAEPLVPGGGQAITMTPRGDSDWALKAPPEGTPVRVRVLALALQDPDGQRLLTEHAFSAEQRERLAALRALQP